MSNFLYTTSGLSHFRYIIVVDTTVTLVIVGEDGPKTTEVHKLAKWMYQSYGLTGSLCKEENLAN